MYPLANCRADRNLEASSWTNSFLASSFCSEIRLTLFQDRMRLLAFTPYQLTYSRYSTWTHLRIAAHTNRNKGVYPTSMSRAPLTDCCINTSVLLDSAEISGV
ncbi:hypothetical protein BgiMline_028821 [Biomphalaria glabrata]|nr:hypothetical protein BgiMline_025464 [Biomphalaria glabrata]